MTINITPETILKLRAEGFYPDEMFSLYFVLKALKENEIEMLNEYDDLNTSKRAVISYQTLFRKGLIVKAKEGSQIFFSLTQKGLELIELIEPVKEIKKIGCSDWIEDWINLFPERCNKRVYRFPSAICLKKMNAFIKEYKFIKEVIFAATKSYLTEESSENYKYAKHSSNFISVRGEGSLLAAWCKDILNNKGKNGELNDGSRTKIIQTVN